MCTSLLCWLLVTSSTGDFNRITSFTGKIQPHSTYFLLETWQLSNTNNFHARRGVYYSWIKAFLTMEKIDNRLRFLRVWYRFVHCVVSYDRSLYSDRHLAINDSIQARNLTNLDTNYKRNGRHQVKESWFVVHVRS